MPSLIIKGGKVFDPLNKVRGEEMDIFIKDGKIVEESKIVPREAKIIDAKGKVVMPGGIDIHTHITGYEINFGRLFRPEDGRRVFEERTTIRRSGSGFTVPSTFSTGYRYARMGYTTLCEPAMPPLLARHTHEELNDTPMVDTMAYTLLCNNWIIMQYLKQGEYEKCAAFVAWMLRATKGYAIKMVNPGGVEAWHWRGNVKDLNDPVPYFGITAAEIIRGLSVINEMLGLPHSTHLHTNQLGVPGNFEITLGSFEAAKDVEVRSLKGRRQSIHITHMQFSAFGGDSWRNFESKASEIAKYVNDHPSVTIDMGQVIPGETTTMTADGPLEYSLHRINRLKWLNQDIELETGGGLVPYIYAGESLVNSTQWAIGLELALLIKDPFQVYLSTDHPNAGPFTRYPRIISWLMSGKAREIELKGLHEKTSSRCILAAIDREYDLYDVAVVRSAGPALALGISDVKGHLGVGADADVAIFYWEDETPLEIEKSFSITAFTIKGGEIVAKDGEILREVWGKRYWVNARVDPELERQVLREVSRTFAIYYTVTMENFPVQMEYVPRSNEIKINATHIA